MSARTPHTCPVCNGNGQVGQGFYTQVSGQWTTASIGFEQCRSCACTGVVWEPERTAESAFPEYGSGQMEGLRGLSFQ